MVTTAGSTVILTAHAPTPNLRNQVIRLPSSPKPLPLTLDQLRKIDWRLASIGICPGAVNNLRAVQLLLEHTKVKSTVRYVGIEVDNALALAEQVDV